MSQLDLFATPKATPTDRAGHLHTARAYLAQAVTFREREQRNGQRPGFSLVLLEWAGNQRRKAA
ncbi:MAG: hypothetical protein WA154_11110 [Moraxellaceae bacterium]